MKYEFRDLDDKTVRDLMELSARWQEEDCSHGIIANTADDLKTPLCVATDNGKTIGYIFGHYYVAKNKTSYVDIGCKCFEIDELYILPEYRSQGVGKKLFRLMEQEVKPYCDYVTLNTSTKDYKRILHFYAEELGMTFHSAFLIKSTEEAV